MPKFIIQWDAGYGTNFEIVTAKTLKHANEMAREEWQEEAEQNAEYQAEEYTKELAEERGIE